MKQIKHNCKGFAWSLCAKKLLFAVLLLSGLLLAGCQKRETPLQEGESEYQVYYMNQAVTKLIAQPYRTRTTDTEELIGELRDFHMRYEVEDQVKERVEKPDMAVMNWMWIFRDLRKTRLRFS